MGRDPASASRRSVPRTSAEGVAMKRERVRRGRILAAVAAALCLAAGAAHVVAVEPDPSELVGRGALARHGARGLRTTFLQQYRHIRGA